jgi:hypothetical protein
MAKELGTIEGRIIAAGLDGSNKGNQKYVKLQTESGETVYIGSQFVNDFELITTLSPENNELIMDRHAKVTFEIDGNFKNLKSLQLMDKPAKAAEAPKNDQGDAFQTPEARKDNSIEKQVQLHVARDLLIAGKAEGWLEAVTMSRLMWREINTGRLEADGELSDE